jgi:hypothetical protein
LLRVLNGSIDIDASRTGLVLGSLIAENTDGFTEASVRLHSDQALDLGGSIAAVDAIEITGGVDTVGGKLVTTGDPAFAHQILADFNAVAADGILSGDVLMTVTILQNPLVTSNVTVLQADTVANTSLADLAQVVTAALADAGLDAIAVGVKDGGLLFFSADEFRIADGSNADLLGLIQSDTTFSQAEVSLLIRPTSTVVLKGTSGTMLLAGLNGVVLDNTIRSTSAQSQIDVLSIQGEVLITETFGKILASGPVDIQGGTVTIEGVIWSTADETETPTDEPLILPLRLRSRDLLKLNGWGT